MNQMKTKKLKITNSFDSNWTQIKMELSDEKDFIK